MKIPVPTARHRYLLPYQIDLVVHVITKARFQAGADQVAIDQVGRRWIFFGLRLMMRTKPAWYHARTNRPRV